MLGPLVIIEAKDAELVSDNDTLTSAPIVFDI